MRHQKRYPRTAARPWTDRLLECLELFYLSTVSWAERVWFRVVSRGRGAYQRMLSDIRRRFLRGCSHIRRYCRRSFFRLRFLFRELLRSEATNVQKMATQTIVLAVLFLLLTGLVFGIAHTVSAREGQYTKYVTCITIEDGDSLWRIAERYITDGYADIPSFIEDIRTCNNLYEDEIHAGEKLIVPYFVPVP